MIGLDLFGKITWFFWTHAHAINYILYVCQYILILSLYNGQVLICFDNNIIGILAKLEFVELDIISKNYLSWILEIEIQLEASALCDTIKYGNKASNKNKVKAMILSSTSPS